MAMAKSNMEISLEQFSYFTFYENLRKQLIETFGNSSLNRDQFAATMSILDGRFDVTLSATAGTLLCYLVPALIRSPKVTLVFCPCIERIESTIKRLQELKIPVITINSQMQMEDQIGAVDNFILNRKRPSLIYMTPDQAFCKHFKKLIHFLRGTNSLAYLILDESCTKEWQMDDENEYYALSKIRYPPLHWIVITVSDNCETLTRLTKILDLKIFGIDSTHEFYRQDKFYDVVIYNNRQISNLELKQFISESLGGNSLVADRQKRPRGLIFCRTGPMAEQIASYLRGIGVLIDSYHPGLERYKRERAFKQFYSGEIQLLAVTSSAKFMKNSYLRLIIHWGLPSSIPEYYEESGLASGSDGVLARCRIYVTNSALSYYNKERESDLKSYLKNDSEEPTNVNARMRLGLYLRTSHVKDYCVFKWCRHQFLNRHIQRKILFCEKRCDYCKMMENTFKYNRIRIRRSIEILGISNFIEEFGEKIKHKYYVKNDKEVTFYAMFTFDVLFKLIAIRSFPGVDLMESNRDRKLLHQLFDEIMPLHVRQVYQCGNNVNFNYYNIKSDLIN